MEYKSFKEFDKGLDWSIRIQFLFIIALIVGAVIFDAWTTNWVLATLFAVALVLGVESLTLYARNHPKTWRLIRWGLLLALLAFLLSGIS